MIWWLIGALVYVAMMLLAWSLCAASAYGQSMEYSPDKPIDTSTGRC